MNRIEQRVHAIVKLESTDPLELLKVAHVLANVHERSRVV
jgi:hypothetical protein